MAIAVVLETRIGRSIEDVYRHLVDLDRWPEWLIATGIRRIEREQVGGAVPGEALRIEQAAAGRAASFDGRVVRAETPTDLAVSGRDAEGVSIDIVASLVPVEPSITVLRWSIRIGVPLRYRIFESLARPQVERAVVLDVEAFKRRLESVADD
jgi:uncharacterized protein YndB with AHSA1/START domain